MTLSTSPDLPAFDIASLSNFYRNGGTVTEIVERVFARIAEVDDPGIFIHLADKLEILAEAEAMLLEEALA